MNHIDKEKTIAKLISRVAQINRTAILYRLEIRAFIKSLYKEKRHAVVVPYFFFWLYGTYFSPSFFRHLFLHYRYLITIIVQSFSPPIDYCF